MEVLTEGPDILIMSSLFLWYLLVVCLHSKNSSGTAPF